MAYSLGSKSLAELNGVHPSLERVVRRAIQITKQDFSVHDGLRTEAEQREYVKRGVSTTMNSMHRKQRDGYGHAVDLVPYINGKLRWEWPPIYVIAAAVQQAAKELGVKLVWGAVWDKQLSELGDTPDSLKRSVDAYVARRKKMGKRAFIDGPHFQLG
jgi:peptidoglycan L-alanyl-D-glutamate endopeptidase CwlK